MIALGFIIVLLAALIGIIGFWLTTSNSTQLQYVAGPFSLELAPVTLFLAGLITMALLWLGWLMIRTGTKRSFRGRRERKQLIRDQREQERQLAVTRARLADERHHGADSGVDSGAARAEDGRPLDR